MQFFLSRNTIKPVNAKKLLESYEETLDRPIDKDVLNEGGKIVVSKGTSVRDAIKSLYKTKCRICGQDALAAHYVWDTVYRFDGPSPSGESGKVLLAAISAAIDSQNPPTELTQFLLLEKWREILEHATAIWDKQNPKLRSPFSGFPKPSIITNQFGKLVREGIYSRVQRRPIMVFYECQKERKHRGLSTMGKTDLEQVDIVDAIRLNSYGYPVTKLRYPKGQLFDTARPDSVLVPDERLCVYTPDEWMKQNLKVHHLFTKRNLLALSILFWSIGEVQETEMREPLLLAFTSTLLHSSKLISSQLAKIEGKWKQVGGAIWMTNRYSVSSDFKEANVFIEYDKAFAKVYDAKTQNELEIGDFFSEATSVDEFVKDKQKAILILRDDARRTSEIFKIYKDVADMVFTDPPYGDAIQYYELCTFWVSWLLLDKRWAEIYGDHDWWQNEVVVNKVQGKLGLDDFKRGLTEVFQSLSEITKKDATWVITYHKREPGYWNALMEAQRSIGLAFFDETTYKLLGRGFNPSKDFKFLETDAYTTWKRFSVEKARTFEEAAEAFFRIISPFVIQHNGIMPRNVIEKAYVEMAWNVEKNVYERFFEGRYDVFLEKHSIQLPTKTNVLVILRRDSPPPGVSSEKWRAVWDTCYNQVEPTILLRYGLAAYISGRHEKELKTSLDDVYHDVISRIDGRIDQDLVFAIIDNIAEYDWIEGTYKPKKEVRAPVGLTKWMLRKEMKLPDAPENLVPRLVEELIKNGYEVFMGKGYEKPDISRVYEKKIAKRIRSDLDEFPIVVLKNQIPLLCIDINTLSRASHALLKGDVKIVILYAMNEIIQKAQYYEKHLKEGKLVLLDVRGKTTADVMLEVKRQMEG